MLTGIFRGFPLNLQTQTIVCFVCDDFLQHADSLQFAQESSKKATLRRDYGGLYGLTERRSTSSWFGFT